MVIGVTGYGASGASALMDLIKEFEGVQAFTKSFEFQLLNQSDGILDLKHSLVETQRRLDTNVVIRRYKNSIGSARDETMQTVTRGKYTDIAQTYIDSLVQLRWAGRSTFDPADIKPWFDTPKYSRINRLIKKIVVHFDKTKTWPPFETRYFSFLTEQEFNVRTREYLKGVLTACGFNLNKPILLEQLFNTSNPLAGAEFFEDVRSIIVDRDPRDVFVLTNYFYPHVCGFMPNKGNVEDFVFYYRKLHKPHLNDDRVIYIQFEDLIYEYDKTADMIAQLLGLSHLNKGKIFKPECSINNTMVYKKYPKLKEKIQYIEQELSDYLYPFEEKISKIKFTPQNVGIFDQQSDIEKRKKR